jgi:hypothetical protein
MTDQASPLEIYLGLNLLIATGLAWVLIIRKLWRVK